MRPSPSSIAERLAGAGLDAADALLDRCDRKYVVPLAALADLVDELAPSHRVLELDGRRAFVYETTYFDTPDLRVFRDHLQQRRQRYKCRSRDYVDGGPCTFEVKLKGARGRTVKHRMAYERERRDELTAGALAFLNRCVEDAYGRAPDPGLGQVLLVACTRMTLLAPGERVTVDFDVRFRAPAGGDGRLAPGTAIVETKSARGDARADAALRRLGARDEARCSKYCLGICLTRRDARRNPLLPLLRKHFVAG